MIQIAICDDEKNIRDYLLTLTKKLISKYEIKIKEYNSPKAYLSEGDTFDILLLDIEMKAEKSDLSGIDLARMIRSRKLGQQPVIIFVTGYEKYVYDAFDVGAFHYLVKPIDEQKFADVLKKAVDQILSEREKQNQTLIIQHANMKKVILLKDIYYIESQNHKVILHTKDRDIEYYAKISDLEQKLQGQFFRIHKGYLINLAYVDEYSKTEVTLSNGETLFISKYKYTDFVKAYLRFMKQGGQ